MSLGKDVLWHLLDQDGIGDLGFYSQKKITGIQNLKGTREVEQNVVQDGCQNYVLNQTLLIIISRSSTQPSVKIDIAIICRSKGSLLWTLNE